MARTRVVWTGLDELKAELKNLPTTMTTETGHLAQANANSAAVDIRGAYPARTGNLRNGVKVEVIEKGPYRTGRRVINRAPHAWIFDNGTQARHTAIGANRGSMPPGRVFVPRIIKWRRRFLDQLKAALLRQGAARVTG